MADERDLKERLKPLRRILDDLEAAVAATTAAESAVLGRRQEIAKLEAQTAKARKDDCERQKSTCEQGCSMCTKMYGPQVVYCVNDCAACRNRISASPCAKDAADDTDCTHALDACLERCGP